MKQLKVLILAALCMISVSANAQRRNANGTTVGYQGFIEMNGGIDVDDSDLATFEITTTHGAQINPNIFVGGGLGFSAYHLERTNKDINSLSIPIFANFKWNILNRKVTPVIDVKTGYLVGVGDEDDDDWTEGPTGFFGSVGVGCRIALGTHAIVPQLTFKKISPKKEHGYKPDDRDFIMMGVTYEF